ncbi:hypothetical protein J6590_058498 [Homalodisca vitripennis]|nr:hypothetical protein J6590_058498 [Homalodisca vitripennis]
MAEYLQRKIASLADHTVTSVNYPSPTKKTPGTTTTFGDTSNSTTGKIASLADHTVTSVNYPSPTKKTPGTTTTFGDTSNSTTGKIASLADHTVTSVNYPSPTKKTPGTTTTFGDTSNSTTGKIASLADHTVTSVNYPSPTKKTPGTTTTFGDTSNSTTEATGMPACTVASEKMKPIRFEAFCSLMSLGLRRYAPMNLFRILDMGVPSSTNPCHMFTESGVPGFLLGSPPVFFNCSGQLGALPHTADQTREVLDALKCYVFPHPPYSSDHALSDYHLFPAMKTWLVMQCFDDNVNRCQQYRTESLDWFFQPSTKALSLSTLDLALKDKAVTLESILNKFNDEYRLINMSILNLAKIKILECEGQIVQANKICQEVLQKLSGFTPSGSGISVIVLALKNWYTVISAKLSDVTGTSEAAAFEPLLSPKDCKTIIAVSHLHNNEESRTPAGLSNLQYIQERVLAPGNYLAGHQQNGATQETADHQLLFAGFSPINTTRTIGLNFHQNVFGRGITTLSFQQEGNFPVVRDTLIRWVIAPIQKGLKPLTIAMDIPSTPKAVLKMVFISSLTFCSDTRIKLVVGDTFTIVLQDIGGVDYSYIWIKILIYNYDVNKRRCTLSDASGFPNYLDETQRLNNFLELKSDKKDLPAWTLTYIKASYYQLFGRPGCIEALKTLSVIGPLKASSEPHHAKCFGSAHLCFLKARILGKLKYLEQWPALKWAEEIKLIESIHTDVESELQIPSTMYLAQLYRLQGYRLFLESCGNDRLQFERAGDNIKIIYSRAARKYRELVPVLRSLGSAECLAWLAEEFFKLPTHEGTTYEDDVLENMREAMRTNELIPYVHRVAAMYFEQVGNIDQAMGHLHVASTCGSLQANVDIVGLNVRTSSKVPDLEELKKLPDGQLHTAYYLCMHTHRFKEAEKEFKEYFDKWQDSPTIMAYTPIFETLHEPINLLHLVYKHRFVILATKFSPPFEPNSTFLSERVKILQESQRLKRNLMFKSHRTVVNKMRKLKKKKILAARTGVNT